MLQYCQAFFICLAQKSNPGKLRAASRSVPPQRNYAAALWDPKPATSQQQSHMPPTRFLLLLHRPLSPLPLRQVSCNTPRIAGGAFKTSPKRSDKKKSLKNMYKLQNIHENIMQTNAGRRSNCLPCFPIPGTFPLPAATHYDLRCGKNEGKVHSVCQRGRHRLRLPLALNFPLFLFSFCRTKNCWVLNIYWVEEYCGINRGWLCCSPKMLLVFHYVFQRFAVPAKFLGLNWGIICVIDWFALA